MAKKTVSRCKVFVNGKKVEYFKSFTEDAREIRKIVRLMDGVAFMDVNSERMFRISYVRPTSNPIDWDAFEDGTVAVEMVGGQRVTFSPVSTLTIGEYTVDGENEVVQPIIFGYEDRTLK